MRTLVALALMTAAYVVAGSPAQAGHPTPDPPLIIADATKQPYIDLYLAAHPNQAMYVSEAVDVGSFNPLASIVLDPGGHRALTRVERWRCDRRNRRFVAALSSGGPPVASFGVRTPSCRRRLEVRMPRRARPGSEVRVSVRDRWRIGDLQLSFCTKAPRGARRCRRLTLAKDRTSLSTRFRVNRRGRWGTALHGPGIRVANVVSVGQPAPRRTPARARVLVAGDSMMQGLDGYLSDRLGDRASVFRDVVPASGISKPGGINWVQRARDRGRRVRPDATVVFLGANEGFDMRTPSGETVTCCAADTCCTAAWLAEYSRRVRAMMESYRRPRGGKVFWLQMPQVRFRERHVLQRRVNAAIRQAAQGLSGVRVVRLDHLFTPGGRYREVMTYRGRRVRVRAPDGIHLTLVGAQIAAGKVYAAMRAAGVVR